MRGTDRRSQRIRGIPRGRKAAIQAVTAVKTTRHGPPEGVSPGLVWALRVSRIGVGGHPGSLLLPGELFDSSFLAQGLALGGTGPHGHDTSGGIHAHELGALPRRMRAEAPLRVVAHTGVPSAALALDDVDPPAHATPGKGPAAYPSRDARPDYIKACLLVAGVDELGHVVVQHLQAVQVHVHHVTGRVEAVGDV